MEQKELVLLKNSPDRLLLVLDGEANFFELLQQMQSKIEKNGNFFRGASTKLKYSGRYLSEEQEQAVVTLFESVGGMDVIDISREISVPIREEGNAFRGIAYGLFDKIQEGKNTRPTKKAKGIFQVAEGLTAYYYGNLSKGQRIVYKGSVVIFGNIEKGAEVIATENVMVFGAVKGAVSVGGKHLKTAVLICEHFAAEGFEIAEIQRTEDAFAEKLKEQQKRRFFEKKRPQMKMLYLVDNRIAIAPLSGL